jgi:hypothetical protein
MRSSSFNQIGSVTAVRSPPDGKLLPAEAETKTMATESIRTVHAGQGACPRAALLTALEMLDSVNTPSKAILFLGDGVADSAPSRRNGGESSSRVARSRSCARGRSRICAETIPRAKRSSMAALSIDIALASGPRDS